MNVKFIVTSGIRLSCLQEMLLPGDEVNFKFQVSQ